MHPEKTLTASETASEAAFKADTSTGFSLNMRLAFRVLTSIWIRILDLPDEIAAVPWRPPAEKNRAF